MDVTWTPSLRNAAFHWCAVICFARSCQPPWRRRWSAAGPGQLVGPVESPQGFLLVLVEERLPAALDAATRQQIENELFTNWLAERTSEARIDLAMAGTA